MSLDVNYNFYAKQIMDLKLQSLILSIDDYYQNQENLFSSSNFEENIIRVNPLEIDINYFEMNYTIQSEDDITQRNPFEYFSHMDYPPLCVPRDNMRSYFAQFLKEINNINKISQRFNVYRTMYEKFHINKENKDFFMVIDKIEAESHRDYYNVIPLNTAIEQYLFDIPSFFKDMNAACKFVKGGGFSGQLYENLAEYYIQLKMQLIESVQSVFFKHFKDTTMNFMDIAQMTTKSEFSDTLNQEITTMEDIKKTLSEYEFAFSLTSESFNKLNKGFPVNFSSNLYKEYLSEYYFNITMDKKLNSTIENFLIQNEKNMLTDNIPISTNALKVNRI